MSRSHNTQPGQGCGYKNCRQCHPEKARKPPPRDLRKIQPDASHPGKTGRGR